MKSEKSKATALLALGLTCLSFAVAVGFLGAVTKKSDPELSTLCTNTFLFLMLGSTGFITLGGIRFDRIKQRELADMNHGKVKRYA